MKVIVLTENRKQCECLNEDGLSLYIEVGENKLLLDTGFTDSFIKNAEMLGVDIASIKTIVLSHGHWDHGNGLKWLKDNKTVIMHPESFTKRYSLKRNMQYAGLNQTFEEMKNKFNVIQTKEPLEVLENIWFLGEIERNNDFEAKTFPTVLEEGKTDYLRDDTGIVIKTEDGIIVISGCSHSGICNTIEYAKKITKEDNVIAVMGGFHLREINESTEKTIQYFINNNIQSAYMGHCTSDEVIEEFKTKLHDKCKVEKLYAGARFEI